MDYGRTLSSPTGRVRKLQMSFVERSTEGQLSNDVRTHEAFMVLKSERGPDLAPYHLS